jgi:hypothetical protein
MMNVSDAFQWPGGGELVLELTLDKGGRPSELREVVDALHRFRWTAAVAEGIAEYAAWLVRNKTPADEKLNTFDQWVRGLPEISTSSTNWSPDDIARYFDASGTERILVALVGLINQFPLSGPGLTGFGLQVELMAAVHENPTKFLVRVIGSLSALAIAAGIWGCVALESQHGIQACQANAAAMYGHQYDLLMNQAKIEGQVTPRIADALTQVTKASFAAHSACSQVLPGLKISLGRIEVSVDWPRPRPQQEGVSDEPSSAPQATPERPAETSGARGASTSRSARGLSRPRVG